jgi:hypothetical protein
MMAFGFGLVHGFGFSFALRESLQFAGSHLLTSLLSFNVGVELGQLLVLVLLVPVLQLLFRYAVAERVGTIILSALVAHTAWHWMLDRGHVLAQFRFEWPAFTSVLLASTLRWVMLFLILGGFFWILQRAIQRWNDRVLGIGWKAIAGKLRIGVSSIARSALSGDSQEGERGR